MGALIAGIALVVVAAVSLVAALLSSRDDADRNFGTNPVGGAVAPCPYLGHAAIRIKKLEFADNHIVERDTYGWFDKPEWLDGRGDPQSPVCLTRGRRVRVTPTFTVTTPPTQTETVAIRAVAVCGDVVLKWTGSVSVSPSDHTVVGPELTSDAALPNAVSCVDAFTSSWGMNPVGIGWNAAGETSNTLYVILGDPVAGVPAYWTLLDLSCRAAAGQTTEAGLVAAVYAPFRSLDVITRKRDGKKLTYWGTVPDYSKTQAMSTAQLLRADNAAGQCGSWASFLLDTYRVHGINSGRKIAVARSAAYWQGNGTVGFLVKKWRFITPPASSPNNWTHTLFVQCVLERGAPGQNNAFPPPFFRNHYIAWINGVYYDPSYGSGPFNSQGDWEVGSFDGLVDTQANPWRAGFDKSLAPNPTTNLLDFVTIAG